METPPMRPNMSAAIAGNLYTETNSIAAELALKLICDKTKIWN
tara:strand:+ start:5806 stop:5934 length:129 start_codon:yes stop_codon:yes gene_type:complete